MSEFMTVMAKKVRVGDTLTGGTYFGCDVIGVRREGNQVVITARSGRREYQIPADGNEYVDIAR